MPGPSGSPGEGSRLRQAMRLTAAGDIHEFRDKVRKCWHDQIAEDGLYSCTSQRGRHNAVIRLRIPPLKRC